MVCMRSLPRLLAFLVLAMFLIRCANPVTPTGGPRDVLPPAVDKASPPGFSTLFKGNDITIGFNEFVELKDLPKNILVSPPMKKNPVITTRGKNLVIKFSETLKPNTTYTLNFGNSITDLTENNVLTDYRYIFSTGTHLDSAMMEGYVMDAFDLKPVEGVMVVLYDTVPGVHSDSLPMKEIPSYVAKTNANGFFRFSYIRNVPYKVFAITDQNNTLTYDLQGERIAFLDSLVPPQQFSKPVPMGTGGDSLVFSGATNPLKLYLFMEIDSTQKILTRQFMGEGEIKLVFRFPFRNLTISDLSGKLTGQQYLEPGVRKDTLSFWFEDKLVDSLFLSVADPPFHDTVRLQLQRKQRGGRKVEAEDMAPKALTYSTNIRSSRLEFNGSPLTIKWKYPVISIDSSRIILTSGTDTLTRSIRFRDPIKRIMEVAYPFGEDQPYRLIIPSGAIQAIRGISNDTIILSFRTKSLRDYGTLSIDVRPGQEKGPFIFQLLNEKNEVLSEKYLRQGEKLHFPFLIPGNYSLKAIVDSNCNQRWDTGVYLENKQPEKVILFGRVISVRANWDVEESWIF
ncbi:MAG: hypothetical protein FJY10_10845 [Bacteroidetes bacterium]|nr:hypothetical protein [Bacteroidota bacterium]